MKETMYVVIPCYNEEQMLPITAKALIKKLDELKAEGRIAQNSKVMFVDDGSKDKTWEIIQKLHEASPVFTGLKLDGFLDKRAEGCDIVYGVRSSREKDTAFKRGTAQAYYKLLEHMGVEITYNHADYRLMSKRAIDALAEFKEVNLFLRGLVPMVGFKSDIVKYVRNERVAGESKYPLKKMLSFAVEGITSLSVKPIRFITTIGIIVFLVSLIMLIYFLITWAVGHTVQGWASTITSIWAIGGLQLLAIGIIGEYIGKIYLETKARPKFIIETNLEETDKE